MSTESQHCVPDPDFQRIIDAEIASHRDEETIRALKTRRNLDSPISRLPAELMARIFLFAKNSLQLYEYTAYRRDKERTWLNVVGVCRRWREIVLDTPTLWTSFDISRNEHASEMLARSKHAPLQLRCSPFANDGQRYKDIGEIIMPHINRIQELVINTHDPAPLSALLCLNLGVPAQILEVFRLKCSTGQFLLCKEILSRGMPSLRVLELTQGNISFALPPLPRLVRLQLNSVHGSDYLLPASMLLLSLQNTPNLEELDLAHAIGGSNDGGTSTMVDLPRLLRVEILGRTSGNLAVLKCIHYSPSTIVKFNWSVTQAQELEESNLAEICSRLGREGTPTICKIRIGFAELFPQCFHLSACINDAEPLLSMRVFCINPDDDNQFLNGCIQLCTAIPLSKVRILHIAGFEELQETGWSDLLSGFGMVEELHASKVNSNQISALLARHHLPRLRELIMENYTFFVSSHDPNADERLLGVLAGLLKERKELETPIETLTLEFCSISEDYVETLKGCVDVKWDEEEALCDESENGEQAFIEWDDSLYDGMDSPSWRDLFF